MDFQVCLLLLYSTLPFKCVLRGAVGDHELDWQCGLLEDFIYFTYEHINVRSNVAELIINVVTLKNQVSYFNCTNICVCCMMFPPHVLP